MIKLGTNNIGKIYLGSNPIGKAYLGSNLVFQMGSSPTPLPYTPVDYIETDGTAYINTRILGNVTKSMEIKLTPVAPESGNSYVMGCRKDSGNTRFIPLMITHGQSVAGFSYAGNIWNSLDSGIGCFSSVTNRTPMRVKTSFSGGGQTFGVLQEGESSWTTRTYNDAESISTGRNLIVFGMDNYGTILHSEQGMRIWYVKIWSNGDYTNIIFDGVACYYNGEYGLWDNVTNSFFANAAGSGAFTGPLIQ